MPWVRLDDHFDEHPKIVAAGPLGLALYVTGLAYSNRNLTDGFIPRAVVPRLITCRRSGQVTKRLVDAGLWHEVDAGYRIHDYLDYQPSKEQVEELRQKRSEAGALGGLAKSKQLAKQNPGKTEAKVYPVPNPKPEGQKPLAADKPPRESKPRKPNPLWDVLVELVGPVATPTETGLRGKNVKELNLVGATPEEVRRRARNWPPPGVHPDAALTAPALVKYWSALDRRASNGPAPYSKDTFTDRVARGEETEHEFLDEKVIELLKQTGLLGP